MDYTEALLLVISFVILLAIRVPIAYSIGLSALFTLVVSMPTLPAMTTLAQRMATSLDSFALLAIPFFILAGQIMNRGGIARRLIDFAKAIVGPLPGGLAFVNIIACMLFGAISGSAVAAASAIGGFMNPMMEKEGYDKSFSAAVNITSATTGLIIPPSNILIIYSLASGGVSIAALFLAGYVPGILIGIALMLVAGVYAFIKKISHGKSRGHHHFPETVFGRPPQSFTASCGHWGYCCRNLYSDRSFGRSCCLYLCTGLCLQGNHRKGRALHFVGNHQDHGHCHVVDCHFGGHELGHELRKYSTGNQCGAPWYQ